MENQTILNFLEIEKNCILKKDAELIKTLNKRGYLLKMEITLVVSKCERHREVKGNSHANGGVRASVKGAPDVELEGGEIIINKNSARMYRKELSNINVMGGGRKFQFGGDVSPNFQAIASASSGEQRRTIQKLEQMNISVDVTEITNMQNRQVSVRNRSSI